MDFELSADQVALAELVRVIVAGRFPLDRVRRAEGGRQVVDPDDWASLAEAGVFSLTLPEAAGGAGLGLADAAVVFEELGRGLVPGPLVPSHLAARLAADGVGPFAGAADGSLVVGAVLAPADGQPWLVEHLDSLGALVVRGPGGRLAVARPRGGGGPGGAGRGRWSAPSTRSPRSRCWPGRRGPASSSTTRRPWPSGTSGRGC